MPVINRHKTKYPGVYFIEGSAVGSKRTERIYYIRYRKNGKIFEEKAGRQFADDMTPARASRIRAEKIEGKRPSNQEKRAILDAEKKAAKNSWTIERLWEEYIENNPTLKGEKTYKSQYKLYLEKEFGTKEPQALVPLDFDRLRLRLLKTKSNQTAHHVLALLRRIINFGAKKGLCNGLKFKIQMPTVSNEKTEDLSSDQLTKLLTIIEKDTHPQAGAMMKMALFTGMRRGEMFKLKWEHIDFERGFILIKDPKGGPDQKIPLNDPARELLDKRPNKADSPYVFPGRKGKQRTDINKAVNEIKKAAGLPKDFRPLHGLRHVYASMLASSGQVDMYTLQMLLTHKDPKMTQRYAHLRDETLKKASNLAGDIIYEIGRTKKSEKNQSNAKENKPTKKKAKSVPGKKTEANNYIIPPGLHLPFVEFLAHFEVAENKPIMIVGETGVGKSIFLHIYKKLCEEEWHDEKSKPKIIIENCACFGDKNSDPLIALSELFGYKKGSHRLSLTSNAGDRSDTACKMSLNIWSRGK